MLGWIMVLRIVIVKTDDNNDIIWELLENLPQESQQAS